MRFSSAIKQDPSLAPKRRPPSATITLEPSHFADEWPSKPRSAVLFGLRILPALDLTTCEGEARKAANATGEPQDSDLWTKRFNDTLFAWAVARGFCDPNDVDKPHRLFEMPEDEVPLALPPLTIRHVYDALERLWIDSSPIYPEADDDEVHDLAAILSTDDPFAGMSAAQSGRARRYVRFLLEELNAPTVA